MTEQQPHNKLTVRNRVSCEEIQLLKSKDFEVVELYPNHLRVSQILKVPLPWTLRLAQCLPLGVRGAEHQDIRKAIAYQIATGHHSLRKDLPALVAQHFQELQKPGAHDLLTDVLIPFVDRIMSVLGGFEIDQQATYQTSSIFDPSCSPAVRNRLENAAKTTFERAMVAHPKAEESEIDCRVAVVVMGRDALLGSLAASLQSRFQANIGQPINAIEFSDVPLNTGVPYVWRQKTGPVTGENSAQNEADTLEFRLDRYVLSTREDRLNLFGVGPHACVGRAVSIAVFGQLGTFLKNVPLRIVASELVLDPKHVLDIPQKLRVELV